MKRRFAQAWISVTIAFGLLSSLTCARGAEIRLRDGTQVTGKIRSRDTQSLQLEVEIDGRVELRSLALATIESIEVNGERQPLTGEAPPSTDPMVQRTAAELRALIARDGKAAPEWFEATPLEYPTTLDLSFPAKEGNPWNNQKNVGQYVWDVINPNPNKWRSGVRLMHYLLQRHQADKEKRRRAMLEIGAMYFRFFQDYPRAAFWWQAAGVTKQHAESIGLAECYWRLGNRELALATIDRSRNRASIVKLLGDMGELDAAIEIAERMAKQVKEPHDALLAAGDACRAAGQLDRAIAFYDRVLQLSARQNGDYQRRTVTRAREAKDAIRLYDQLDVAHVRDGTYRAASPGYEADVGVAVTVRSGRIESVEITESHEKQFYSALRDMPEQIVQKQSVRGIDATSRATLTAEAVLNATAKALAQGTKQP